MAGRNGTQLTIPLMVLAFLTIGGFIYWLSVETESVRVAIAEEEEVEEEETGPVEVSLEEFSEDPAAYEGEEVSLQNLQAFSQLSPPLFQTLLPDGMMYLVYYEQGYSVEPGAYVNVVGTVRMMSDQVLNEWQERGMFADPSQREELSITETYIEAGAVADATEEEEGAEEGADTAGQPGGN